MRAAGIGGACMHAPPGSPSRQCPCVSPTTLSVPLRTLTTLLLTLLTAFTTLGDLTSSDNPTPSPTLGFALQPLRVFVHRLPEPYCCADYPNLGTPLEGHRALGNVIDPDAELYEGGWTAQDNWFLQQMLTSSMNVSTACTRALQPALLPHMTDVRPLYDSKDHSSVCFLASSNLQAV